MLIPTDSNQRHPPPQARTRSAIRACRTHHQACQSALPTAERRALIARIESLAGQRAGRVTPGRLPRHVRRHRGKRLPRMAQTVMLTASFAPQRLRPSPS
jgi:hypothetical protein